MATQPATSPGSLGTRTGDGDGAAGAAREAGPRTRRVRLTVNGQEHERQVEPRMLLVHFLRDELRLTGTHIGCDTTNCGACTVRLDDVPVKSCTLFAVQADGARIDTVEGLEGADGLHPVQEGFREEHGLQCGFCTPGMMLVAASLLERNPDPGDAEIRHAISGNLCRCTGYQNIVRAVRYAADKMAGRPAAASAGDGAGQEAAAAEGGAA